MRVENHLLDTRMEEGMDILEISDSPTITERHQTLPRDLRDQSDRDAAFPEPLEDTPFPRGHDVEEEPLVCLLVVEDPDGIDRVTDVPWVLEVDCLDESSLLEEEAGDDARPEHVRSIP